MTNLNAKYCIDTDENRLFLKTMGRSLLYFGMRFPSPGGGAYYLGDDGTPWTERDRDTYATARMVHSYSLGAKNAAALETGTELDKQHCLELADRAINGLLGELHDDTYGGWYPSVAANGAAAPMKLSYAHAHVILAGCSGTATGNPRAKALLSEALEIFDRRFWNEKEGLASDTWNSEFTVQDDYRGINANMHTVEAFLAVADVLRREDYRRRAGRMIDRMLGWAEANNWRIPEHYTRNWEPDLNKNRDRPDDQFKPYGATPGHGLEWSRLTVQWALSTETCDKDHYVSAARQLYARAVADGWCSDGQPGIVYTTDWEGRPIVHDRMHWTLAEAVNAAAVLYRTTGDTVYADDYAMFMEYLDNMVLDHVNGSWFHQLDRNNHLAKTVWPGKPDIYHALQATLIPYADPRVSIIMNDPGGDK